MAKTMHLLIWESAPNESDPDGDGYLACGREYDNANAAERASRVTCKRCLKAISAMSHQK